MLSLMATRRSTKSCATPKATSLHASIADIVADVAANSIEAHASVVEVEVSEVADWLKIVVVDNGKGMDAATCARAFDPFFSESGKHDARKIGMGLPFVRQTCEACSGEASLESQEGVGTKLICSFRRDSFDLPPMGNMASTVLTLFNSPGEFNLIFTHRKDGESYTISRQELLEALGELDSVANLKLAADFLVGQEESLTG